MPPPMSKTSRRPGGQRARAACEIRDAQADVLERARLARAFGVEERQLAAAGVASHAA